jgi:hypothetical protein
MKSLTKNRLKLVFIAILFAFPVMTAWVVYKNPALLEGVKTKNHGELISPAIPSKLSNYISHGAEVDMEHLKGRWVLVHIDLDGKCNEECEKSVHMLRQLNVLLNKDSERLRRVYLNISNGVVNELLLSDTNLNVYPWTAELVAKLNSQIKGLVDGDMLLMDPLGNIMMKYHQDADPYGIQKDLKLLFKTSQIG